MGEGLGTSPEIEPRGVDCALEAGEGVTSSTRDEEGALGEEEEVGTAGSLTEDRGLRPSVGTESSGVGSSVGAFETGSFTEPRLGVERKGEGVKVAGVGVAGVGVVSREMDPRGVEAPDDGSSGAGAP